MGTTIHSEGYPYILSALALMAIVSVLGVWILAALIAPALLFSIYFFRDPERNIPEKKNVVLSPADGKVMDVAEVEKDENLGKPAKIVHIFLSPFDVHINRSPVSGKVESVWRKSGKFLPAFLKSCTENEQNYIKIKFGKQTLVMVQVVGCFARRIKCWVKQMEKLEIGQKIGLIHFGSGTRLIMPKNVKVLVKEGDKVKAGETIIAKYK